MLIVTRLFPLTVILTPATLTVAPFTEIKEDRCSGVRTLNFELEKTKNWRNEERINGLRVLSLSLYNSTVSNSDTMAATPFNETFFDYCQLNSSSFCPLSAISGAFGSKVAPELLPSLPNRKLLADIVGQGPESARRPSSWRTKAPSLVLSFPDATLPSKHAVAAGIAATQSRSKHPDTSAPN